MNWYRLWKKRVFALHNPNYFLPLPLDPLPSLSLPITLLKYPPHSREAISIFPSLLMNHHYQRRRYDRGHESDTRWTFLLTSVQTCILRRRRPAACHQHELEREISLEWRTLRLVSNQISLNYHIASAEFQSDVDSGADMQLLNSVPPIQVIRSSQLMLFSQSLTHFPPPTRIHPLVVRNYNHHHEDHHLLDHCHIFLVWLVWQARVSGWRAWQFANFPLDAIHFHCLWTSTLPRLASFLGLMECT